MSLLSLYRNQSIDLLCKSVDWFLYKGNNGILMGEPGDCYDMLRLKHVIYAKCNMYQAAVTNSLNAKVAII